MTELQLTIDGREVPADTVKTAPLTPTQLEILRHARLNNGQITTTAAGRIMHANRENGGTHMRQSYGSPRCCQYCSSDGSDALARLRNRGLVRRVSRGLWELRA